MCISLVVWVGLGLITLCSVLRVKGSDGKMCDLCFYVQVVMDQLNPGLRNLVNLGKSYEKAVTGAESTRQKSPND